MLLVITYQEIALLLPPPPLHQGPPSVRGRSNAFLTPSLLEGGWGEEQGLFDHLPVGGGGEGRSKDFSILYTLHTAPTPVWRGAGRRSITKLTKSIIACTTIFYVGHHQSWILSCK